MSSPVCGEALSVVLACPGNDYTPDSCPPASAPRDMGRGWEASKGSVGASLPREHWVTWILLACDCGSRCHQPAEGSLFHPALYGPQRGSSKRPHPATPP